VYRDGPRFASLRRARLRWFDAGARRVLGSRASLAVLPGKI